MENFLKLVFAFVIGFILVVIAMPKVIPFLHKMKFGQVEREEGLASHKKKNGTPTMGGIVFVLAAIVAAVIVNIGGLFNPELILTTIVLVGYSAIGFVDDALIIIKHSNKGLPPLAKLLAQIALAIICYFFAMNFIPDFTSVVTIPVIKAEIDFGILYPALILIMFAGASNGVNLSDGLDGLATGLSMVAIAPFIIFATMTKDYALASYATAMVGALLGFMMFNYHPAKIFMGDVGSLGLGGFIAILAILTKQELLLILVGGVLLMETLSVIIQVVSFKVTISFWFIGFICGILSIVIGVL